MPNSNSTPFIPVFPLPLFLLPEGKQRLRIFETKYLSMMSLIHHDNQFVLARYDKTLPFDIPDWGTLVRVTDFNIGEDQVLLIDVEAISLLHLENMKYQENGLLLAQTASKQHWDISAYPPKNSNLLIKALKNLFDEHPHFGELYLEHDLSRMDWVSARLLEVLPIPLKEKERFIKPDSLPTLVTMLNNIFAYSSKQN
ncbi:LON peptidase substrate-binding domain-containing protein [Vibrio paucivorans]|uniref:Lon N-terminal domain-containing protein n=1 Tax=Vibrio paucivorans TaxID=2829489 RepID=A0A9X3HRU2_9VIBR|nr:LON peptidase substrate-binding domain-containing protein [Vibrio paucivorans]MCW8334209.1 hypothetical protein [Vibrio paucivorans]